LRTGIRTPVRRHLTLARDIRVGRLAACAAVGRSPIGRSLASCPTTAPPAGHQGRGTSSVYTPLLEETGRNDYYA